MRAGFTQGTLTASGGGALTAVSGFVPAAGNFALYSSNGLAVNGQTLTLVDTSGSLGNKSPALPQWYFDYAAGTLNPNPTYSAGIAAGLSFATNAGGANPTVITSGALLPVGAAGAAQQDMTNGNNNLGPNAQLYPNTFTAVGVGALSTIYHCVTKLYNWTPGVATSNNTNLKSMRVWSGFPIAGGSQNNAWINEACAPVGGGIAFQDTVEGAQGFGGHVPQANVLTVREVQFQNPSALGVRDAKWQMIADGNFVAAPTARFTGANGSFPGMMTVSVTDQISNNAEPAGSLASSTWDYFDNTWQRLMWSPEPLWQSPSPGIAPQPAAQRTINVCTSWVTTGGVSTITFVNSFGANANQTNQNLYGTNVTGDATKFGQMTALAFDFFISNTGSDANPGTLASPWAITALQSHSATYAGKKLALIAGTYDVSGLNAPLRGSGSSFFNVPLFSVPNGINAANPTYIASCDASGHYSQRAAWLSAKTATPYTTLPNGPQSYTGSYTTFNQVPNEGGLIGNTSATCHDIVIDGLRLSGVRSTPLAFGGGPQGGTSGTTYTNTGIVVKNCEVFDCNDTAFGVAGGNYSAVQFFNCIGAVAFNNYIHNLVAFSTSSTASNGHLSLLLFWVCRDHTVTYNTGREAGGFYEKEGGNQGGTYAYNYVEHQVNPGGEGMNNLTGYNSSPLADTTKIYNNVFKMNANGYRLVPNLANGNGQGFSTPLQIFNNTMYWTNTSVCGLEMFAMPGTAAVGGFQFYNNIMCGAAQTNEGNFTFNPAAMQTIGFNVWQTLRYVVTSNTTGSAFTGATTATTFAAARTAVGSATFENASVLTAQTIPQLFTQTGTSADQFKLLAGSAALNAGYTNGTGTGGAVCDAGAFSGPNAPPGGLIGSTLNGVKD